jgi:hypothetical protein
MCEVNHVLNSPPTVDEGLDYFLIDLGHNMPPRASRIRATSTGSGMPQVVGVWPVASIWRCPSLLPCGRRDPNPHGGGTRYPATPDRAQQN